MEVDTPAYRIGLLSRFRIRTHIYKARSEELDQLKCLYGSDALEKNCKASDPSLDYLPTASGRDKSSTADMKRQRAPDDSPKTAPNPKRKQVGYEPPPLKPRDSYMREPISEEHSSSAHMITDFRRLGSSADTVQQYAGLNAEYMAPSTHLRSHRDRIHHSVPVDTAGVPFHDQSTSHHREDQMKRPSYVLQSQSDESNENFIDGSSNPDWTDPKDISRYASLLRSAQSSATTTTQPEPSNDDSSTHTSAQGYPSMTSDSERSGRSDPHQRHTAYSSESSYIPGYPEPQTNNGEEPRIKPGSEAENQTRPERTGRAMMGQADINMREASSKPVAQFHRFPFPTKDATFSSANMNPPTTNASLPITEETQAFSKDKFNLPDMTTPAAETVCSQCICLYFLFSFPPDVPTLRLTANS